MVVAGCLVATLFRARCYDESNCFFGLIISLPARMKPKKHTVDAAHSIVCSYSFPTWGHCDRSWQRIAEVIGHFLQGLPCFPLCHLDVPQNPIEFWHAFFKGTFKVIIYLQAPNGSQAGFYCTVIPPLFPRNATKYNSIEYSV